MGERASRKLNRTLFSYVKPHIGESFGLGHHLQWTRIVQYMPKGVERDVTPLMSTAEMERYLRGMRMGIELASKKMPEMPRCYACDSGAVGTCDRTNHAEARIVDACARHADRKGI